MQEAINIVSSTSANNQLASSTRTQPTLTLLKNTVDRSGIFYAMTYIMRRTNLGYTDPDDGTHTFTGYYGSITDGAQLFSDAIKRHSWIGLY